MTAHHPLQIQPPSFGFSFRIFTLVLAVPFGLPLAAVASMPAAPPPEASEASAESQDCSSDDTDGDGIPNSYELGGYYYDPSDPSLSCDGILPCDGASSVTDDQGKTWTCIETNPQAWSTDEDPFSDYTETSGNNLPPSLIAPYNSPLVAALPIVSVALESYTLTPITEITDSTGTSSSESTTHSTTNTNEVGGSAGFSGASLTGSASYSHTWSSSDSTTESDTSSWSSASTTDPSQAAYLSLVGWFENLGPVAVSDATPTFIVTLNGDTIQTITLDTAIADLGVVGSDDSRYPASGSVNLTEGEGVVITLDQYQGLQSGAALGIVVTQVTGDVNRWDASTDSFTGTAMNGWQSEIDAVNARINVYDTDLNSYLFYATANPSGDGETFQTVEQALVTTGLYSSKDQVFEAYDSTVPEEQTLTVDNWTIGLSQDLLDDLGLSDESTLTQENIDQLLAQPIKALDTQGNASQLQFLSAYDAVNEGPRLPIISSTVYTAYQVDCDIDDSIYDNPTSFSFWYDYYGEPTVIFDPRSELPNSSFSVSYVRVQGSLADSGAALDLDSASATLEDSGGGQFGWEEDDPAPDAWAWATDCEGGVSGCTCNQCVLDDGKNWAYCYWSDQDVSLPCAQDSMGSAWIEVYVNGADEPSCYSYLGCVLNQIDAGCGQEDPNHYFPAWPAVASVCNGSVVLDDTNQTQATAPTGLEVTGQESNVPPPGLPVCYGGIG